MSRRKRRSLMARHKSAKSCAILPWLSAKSDNAEKRFVQVGNSLLLSPRFQRLSAGGRYTYLAMALEAGGKRSFCFPARCALKYGISRATFWRYVTELRESGFITVQSGANVREANIYTFSLAWKDGNSF